MVKKLVLVFAILALVCAFAGTVPAVGNYKITLLQPSVVKGTDLKPGEYRLTVNGDKITLVMGKLSVEAPATIETVEKKFDATAVRYSEVAGKQILSEIRVGGTKTKITINQ